MSTKQAEASNGIEKKLLVEPCVNRIVSATHESHSLAAQRDALLPRLVSGEIKV